MGLGTDGGAIWILLLAGLWAGAQNALAGGGSFVTLPALMLTGLDARTANITSTVAVFPGQVTTAITNWRLVSGVGRVGFAMLFAISAISLPACCPGWCWWRPRCSRVALSGHG